MSLLAVAEHEATVEDRGRFPNVEHRFVCSCGASGPWVRVMGMVHGSEASHLEDVAAGR